MLWVELELLLEGEPMTRALHLGDDLGLNFTSPRGTPVSSSV